MTAFFGHLLFLGVALASQEQEVRPPLGQHLRDLDRIPSASGVALDDGGGLWALEQEAGRLLRIEADGQRRVLNSDLRSPRDVALGPDGELFVSEGWGRGVLRLDAEGTLLASFGADRLLRPQGLALHEGLLYVVDRGRHRIEVYDLDGRHRFGFGGHGFEEGRLIEPTDVALHETGRIFVSDSGNSRVQLFDSAGNFIRAWGDWGPFPGLFSEPTGIVVRGDQIFVADRGNHRVQVFDDQGKLLDRFGLHAIRPREGAGFLHYPAALALSPNGEFAALAEPVVDRVQLFCRTGGTPEDDVRRQAQQLARPSAHYGMDIEISGPYLAMSEPESHSIVFYENTYTEPRRITRIAGLGTKTGLLSGVGGLHFERERRDLWVCDARLRRLSCYRLRGSEEDEVGFDPLMARFVKSVDLRVLHDLELRRVLTAPPEPVAIDRDARGRFYVCDRRNACVLVLDRDFSFVEVIGAGLLVEPTGLAVSADGMRVDVADASGSVHAFHGAPRAHRQYLPPAGSRFVSPYDVAHSPTGDVFVSDSGSHRVYAFAADGEFLREWGGAGLARGEFYKPRGLDFDHRGQLTVIDHANHRGQTFTTDGEYVGVFGLRLYTKLARSPEQAPKESEELEDSE